jgi:arginase family enzyme
MDMVEVNPQFSEDNGRTDATDTANLGLQIIASALGNSIL